jgi:hypothetical protein
MTFQRKNTAHAERTEGSPPVYFPEPTLPVRMEKDGGGSG